MRPVLPALAVALALASPARAEVADLILTRGKVVTVDATFSVGEAVAIRGTRIVAVGTSKAIDEEFRGSRTRVVDVQGRTVIPGLIDGHIHFVRRITFAPSDLDLFDFTTRRDALAAVAAKVKERPAGAWVKVIGGWSESQFGDDPSPFRRTELDRIAPTNPLFLQVGYTHAYVNTRALEAAGVALSGAPGVDAGGIERDASGFATGKVVAPQGLNTLRNAFERVMETSETDGVRAFARTLNELGVTAVLDQGAPASQNGMGGPDTNAYAPVERLAAMGELTVRHFRTIWFDTPDLAGVPKTIEAIRTTTGFRGNDFYEIVGIGETIYSQLHDLPLQPIRPTLAERAALRDILTAAAEAGWPFHIHAIEQETLDVYLDEIEAVAAKRNIKPLRWTIEHALAMTPTQLLRIRDLGLALALQSTSSFDASFLRSRGAAGLAMPPLASVQRSGVPWGLGTDGTVVGHINPFLTLGWAVTGRMANGQVVNREPVSREEALIAHTRTNAYLLVRENSLGSIEPGKLADLVVLNRDYLTVPADEIRTIRPVATMVGGRFVYERRADGENLQR